MLFVVMSLGDQPLNAADSGAARAAPAASASLQGACTIIDQAIVSLTSFLVTVVIGRELGKDALGVYTLGIFTFWLAAGIANALVWVPYTARSCRETPRARLRFLASNALMAVAIAVGLALVSAAAGVVTLVVETEQQWLAPMFFCLAPVALTLTLREHVRRVSIADFRTVWLVAFDLVISVALLVAIALLSGAGRLTTTTAFLATAGAAAVCLPVIYWQIASAPLSLPRVIRDFGSNWNFGRWLLVGAVAWLVGDGSLRWMLSAFHGAKAMGEFGAVFSVLMLVNPLLLAMFAFDRSLAARVLNEGGPGRLLSHALWSTLAAIAIATVAVMTLAWWGDFLIRLVYGEAFSNPGLVTVLAAGICMLGVMIPVEAALTALEMGRKMTQVSLAQLATSILVGAPLVFLHGPAGIGWAMIARGVPALLISWEALWRACSTGKALTAATPARA